MPYRQPRGLPCLDETKRHARSGPGQRRTALASMIAVVRTRRRGASPCCKNQRLLPELVAVSIRPSGGRHCPKQRRAPTERIEASLEASWS